jgi:hypothetical protein
MQADFLNERAEVGLMSVFWTSPRNRGGKPTGKPRAERMNVL